jgi:thiosulfate sulfurtransferase
LEVKGKTLELTEPMNHYTYDSIRQYLDKMNRYSDLAIVEVKQKKITFWWFYVTVAPFLTFFRMYVSRRGFLDPRLRQVRQALGKRDPEAKRGLTMDSFKEISVEQATKMLKEGKSLFVDVRDPGSYQAGHVPGALSLNDSNVEKFVKETDKSKSVVCYCYHGHTSQGAAAYLMDQGFKEVYSVAGGFELWRTMGEIEK